MRQIFDRQDIPVVVLGCGVALLAFGASRLHSGLGCVVLGLALILYVRPLRGWL